MRLTASVAGSITLSVPAALLATQTMPFGARASVRGALPTAISASLARVTVSNTVTESLSWLTTQTRGLPVARGSTRIFAEALGRLAVGGR